MFIISLFLLLFDRLHLLFSIPHIWFCVSIGLCYLLVSIFDLHCLIDFIVTILNLLLNQWKWFFLWCLDLRPEICETRQFEVLFHICWYFLLRWFSSTSWWNVVIDAAS